MLRDVEGSHLAVGSTRWQHVGKRFSLINYLLKLVALFNIDMHTSFESTLQVSDGNQYW